MKISLYFIIANLIYTLVVLVVYFKKEKVKNDETILYRYFIFLSAFNLLIELILCINIVLKIDLYSLYNIILNKIFLTTLFIWYMLFTYYTIAIILRNSKKDNHKFEENFNLFKKTFMYFVIVVLVIINYLPIDLVNTGQYAYSTGKAIYFMMGINIVVYFFLITLLILNYKTISRKKIIPFIAVMGCLAITILMRFINPGILLNSFSVAFPTILMFFTIENPDLKVIDELTKMQKITESINNDKSQFIMTINDSINSSIKDLRNTITKVESCDLSKELQVEIANLKTILKNTEINTKNAIDVTSLDSKYLQVLNHRYNINILLESLYLQYKSKINHDNIDFRLNINSEIPAYLYGDQIKLKQILITLIENSISHTEKGFIEISVNHTIKYDICRLAIIIDDSGKGIDIIKQSELNSIHEELNKEDLARLDNMNLNLKTIKKITSLIGGTITINSKETIGTRVEVILNQKIVENYKNESI